MKKVLFIALFLSMVSCKKEEKKAITKEKAVAEDIYMDLYGNWVGNFTVSVSDSLAKGEDYVYSNKLNLVIKKIQSDGKAFGQSIVAGNSRPLYGMMRSNDGKPDFILHEPEERKDDGRFEFIVSNDTIKGTWFVNDKKNVVWERKFVLTKQPFKYDPKLMLPEEGDYVDYYSMKVDSAKYQNDNGEEETYYDETYRVASDVISKLNASTALLTENDLKNLKKLELEIIRNTIFARHGYTFKKKSFRQFFDPVAWYIPVTDDMSGKLTALEQKNIVLLNRFQKYAEDNYDSFGR